MKKYRLLLIPLLIGSLMGLSGCDKVKQLFNDDDLAYENKYNPQPVTPEEDPTAVKAGGVIGKAVEGVDDTLVFKSIWYGKDESIANTYKTGGVNHKEYNVNGGEDYYSNKSKNNYDLYVPNSAKKDDKHVVILFIHGGAWVSGIKTQVNQYVHEFANRGYITATIKYTLLKREMNDSSLSIFRNLDEIDACIASIKSCLEELEFDTTKTNLVIGGASSGAHLAMLYSYSRGDKAVLPIKFLVNAVGPVDIKSEGWVRFKNASDEVLEAGLTKDAIQAQKDASNLETLDIMGDKDEEGNPNQWNEYHTMRIANGMCGIPFSLETVKASSSNQKDIDHPNEASNSLLNANGGEDQLSVTYWMNGANKYPIICAYGGKDSIVGAGQYARLEKALDDNSIEHKYFYFKNSNHTEIGEKWDAEQYGKFVNQIDDWCKDLL